MHFIRSNLAIMQQGGAQVSDGETLMPDPILVERNEAKLAKLGAMGEGVAYTTDLDAVLADAR